MKLLLALFGTFAATQAFLFGPSGKWDSLRSTWNLNPFSSYGFRSQPRDLGSDSHGSYVMKENYCTNKGSPFLGQAYWESKDPTIVLLYDVNGFIAGMQTFADSSKYTPSKKAQGVYFTNYGNYWVLTVYFVDPSIICTTGRTQAQYDADGTGDGLWIQNGPSPLTNVMQIPNDENAVASTSWTEGKCFYTMGQHFWYNLSAGMDCDDFVPYCILYNSGKLDAFCFAMNANLVDDRYDSPAPTPSVLGQFMNPVPSCMNDNNPDYNHYSTIHVYMTNSPRSTFC